MEQWATLVTNGAADPTQSLRIRMRVPLRLIIGALLTATIAGYLGSWWWVFDLAAHFRPHLTAVGAALVLVLAVARHGPGLTVCLLLASINAAPLIPYLGFSIPSALASTANVRVLTFNLHGDGTNPDQLLALLDRERPDIVVLTELPSRFDDLARELHHLYPTLLAGNRETVFDVAVFTRWTVEHWYVDRSSWLPVLEAHLCDTTQARRCLTLVALHAARPIANGCAFQRRQLASATRMVAAAGGQPTLVVGDLNLTPWAPTFTDFLHRAHLTDTATTRPLTATWLSRIPVLGLPLDHILVGGELRAVSSRVAEDLGSDHLPVIADLALN